MNGFKKIFLIAAEGVIFLAAALYIFCPKPLLLEPYNFSTAVYDKNGKLLNLALTMDEKYRLYVPYEKINKTAVKAVIAYEDKRFFSHLGVDIFSLFRSFKEMVCGGRKQGASTLSMQTARLKWRLDTSSVSGKFVQILRALQLERHYSKQEILEAYFNLCPMGGNIEGIGAASLIYFNTSAERLTLAQAAALMVIPQNPNKRAPFSKDGAFEIKKAMKRLQKQWGKLYGDDEIDIFDMPIEFDKHLPKIALHTARRLKKSKASFDIYSTLDLVWQKRVEERVKNYIDRVRQFGVYNAAVLIVNTKTMEVLAEVGSADFFDASILGQVDGITALRSSGSTLKPFIYALSLERGLIHPFSLLKDVPMNYGVYSPENFDLGFKGLISATDALVFSRNVPAVDLLFQLNDHSFYDLLKNAGIPKLKAPEYYGLSIALGGLEVSMQNLAELYAMLANLGQFQKLRYIKGEPQVLERSLLSKESAYLILEMLKTNPAVDKKTLPYLSKMPYEVYWKTGTSFGFRDAWSAGISGDYVFVVWLGNFDNTPNNALTGRTMAAPLMFELIRMMASDGMIIEPSYFSDDLHLTEVEICETTGELYDKGCEHIKKTYFIPNITKAPYTRISKTIAVDVQSGLRVCRHEPPKTVLKTYPFWSSQVYQLYEKAGIDLKRAPEFLNDCTEIAEIDEGMAPQIKAPLDGEVYLKKGSDDKMALRAETGADAKFVLWYVDDVFVGKSIANETFFIDIPLGEVSVRAVDDLGRNDIVSIKGKRFF